MPISREPAIVLRERLATELGASFTADRPIAIRTAYEPIDVMGGFSGYTGATVVSAAADRSCSIAIQPRDDRQIQVFSFGLFDQHKPFTLIAPLDAITKATPDQLRQHFQDPNTTWAACAVGCVRSLQALSADAPMLQNVTASTGRNIAILADTSDPAAHVAATMRALLDPDLAYEGETLLQVAKLCRQVLSEIVDEPTELRRIIASLVVSPQQMVGVRSQPDPVVIPVLLPDDVKVGVADVAAHPDHTKQLARLRVGAEMGRILILDKMRQLGQAAGRELIADPIGGCLANLDLNDYRRFFRPFLPETFKGGAFLLQHGRLADKSLHVEPDHHYPIQLATDFHVFGANRTKNFIQALTNAHGLAIGSDRTLELNKAGHLLYAAHKSLNADAGIDTTESDKVVDWVRANESQGYYGAVLTPNSCCCVLTRSDLPFHLLKPE